MSYSYIYMGDVLDDRDDDWFLTRVDDRLGLELRTAAGLVLRTAAGLLLRVFP